MKHVFFIAGEKSGDLLGSQLLKTWRKSSPSCWFSGVGGPEMRGEELECVLRTEEFEIIGFSEILRALPKLSKQFRLVRDTILKERPDVVVFIDYPGFNMRMARALRKHGYAGKLVQYISPTVWAWGKGRMQPMAETLDLLLTIYPFEKKYFAKTPLKVEYVGNPVCEVVRQHSYDDDWARLFGIKDPSNLVAIFPGSRKSEIHLNLPYQLEAAALIKKEHPGICFAISCAHEKIMPEMYRNLQNVSLKLNKDIFLIPKAYSYELMRDSRCAIAKSGTVTLELALHKCPSVVIYKLTRLNRLIAQHLLRLNLPHYCIVNILQGKTVFPELIEKGLTGGSVYSELQKFIADTIERKTCIEECTRLADTLTESHVSERAVQAIEALSS